MIRRPRPPTSTPAGRLARRRPASARWLARGLAALAVATMTSLAGAVPQPETSPETATRDASSELDGQRMLREIDAAIEALDLAAAREVAERMPSGPRRAVALARCLHAEGRYREAVGMLRGAMDAPSATPRVVEEARRSLELVEGTLEATHENTPRRSPDGRVEVLFADARDVMLAPYVIDVATAADTRVGEALDVHPPSPLRFEIFDAPESLALATPLSLKAVYTTGTVGLCKYNKIMQLSPRTMLYGYGWGDTLTHEYTHLLVTIRSKGLAPVWLQEGLAKLYEQRWRVDGVPALPASRARMLREAIEDNSLITLEQMHPSIALLPSQRDAALAYTEVQTMLALVWRRGGDAAIRSLLDDVASGAPPKQALARAWGADFETFMSDWKADVMRRTRGEDAEFEETRFREREDEQAVEDVFSHLEGGRGRQLARLGLLLAQRGHLRAAATEFQRARESAEDIRRDPVLARELGRIFIQLDAPEAALPLLELASAADPERASLAADHGRALLRVGRTEQARERLYDAIYMNPYIPSLHCDLAQVETDPARVRHERSLCEE